MRALGFRRQAYTLIEVLVLVTLMGLSVAALMPSLVRAATTDPLARTMKLVRDADRLARQQAFGTGARLSLVEQQLIITVGDTIISKQAIPEHCSVLWTPTHDASSTLWYCDYDRSGRSLDFVVHGQSGNKSQIAVVHGLAGLWELSSPSTTTISPLPLVAP